MVQQQSSQDNKKPGESVEHLLSNKWFVVIFPSAVNPPPHTEQGGRNKLNSKGNKYCRPGDISGV